MKLDKQVVSLNLSIKLRELNVKQDSLFYYECLHEHVNLAFIPTGPQVNFVNEKLINDGKLKFYSAFTVAELGELIPYRMPLASATQPDNHLHFGKHIDGFFIGGYVNHDNGSLWPQFQNTNEADMRAEMLIYLIESKLLTPIQK